MKSLKYIRISLLCFSFICCLSTLKGADIYVSYLQTGVGSGTRTDPYSLAAFYTNIINAATALSESQYTIYFEKGGTYEIREAFASGTSSSSSRGFSRTIWNGKTIDINTYGDNKEAVIFQGNGISSFIEMGPTRSNANNKLTITFKNIIFEDFSTSGSTAFIALQYHNAVYLENVTIRNCNNTGAHLMAVTNANSELNISGSSIINNNRGSNYVINITNASSVDMHNNTFSGNTATYAVAIATSGIKFFNNTVYNSGNVYVTNSNSGGYVINNLMAGTSQLIQSSGNAANAKRNISVKDGRVVFYEKGLSYEKNITSGFNQQFDINLSGSEPGKVVHRLKNLSDPDHVILGKGGTQYTLASVNDLGSILETDQLNEKRYVNYPVSIGSVDAKPFHVLAPVYIVIPYNTEEGIMPEPQTIQLTEEIILEYPSGVVEGETSFVLIDESKENGTLSPFTNDYKTTFTPHINEAGQIVGENITCSFTYKALSSNKEVETSGKINVTVYDQSRPPGMVDPADNPTTCFDYMGAVEFGSTYKFVTGSLDNNNMDSIRNYLVETNPGEDRLYGLQIPLVGDLNGDGYPEIVALGIEDNKTTGLSNTAQYIYVYNGQTGERIIKFPFPNNYTWNNEYYHVAPSQLALVDSDRDGKGEIIIAFGANGAASSSSYSKTVASFEVVLDAHNNIVGLTEKWSNKSVPYDLPGTAQTGTGDNYTKPLPQVVDIEGDGTPEVIVYNKIYNAVTGDHLLSLDVLGQNAYVGRDANSSNTGDRAVGFSYLYDIDLDGKYDYVAGGKVYYDIDLTPGATPAYKTVTVLDGGTAVPDGRTGVADVNGDGIPDIIVVRRAGTGSSANMIIYIWDPDLLYTDENKQIKRRPEGYIPNPKLLAKKTISNFGSGGGSYSYVYIGDIDGRVQKVEIEGKTMEYKLPEIAILGGSFTSSQNNRGDLHPNVESILPGEGSWGIPTSGSSLGLALLAFTWDADPLITDLSQRLKLSFILGHEDSSASTGFTMFDFDNDGVQEICYRDMNYLRIIKATVPYVEKGFLEDHASGSILFRRRVNSYTGFEYPVIADIDNDASAEMIVMGYNANSNGVYGFVYAVGAGKDKFAPALPVWNQCMYSPFKINPDLTTPIGKAINPLDPKYTYRREIKDENGQVVNVIPEYKPYNGTLLQVPYHVAVDDENGNPNFEPIVYLVESYIDEDYTSMEGSFINIRIGNRSTARTDISENTPIRVYRSAIAPGNLDKAVDDGLHTIRTLGHTAAIKAGEYIDLAIPVSSPTGVYYVRLGDNSDSSTGSWVWRYGKNKADDAAPDGQAIGIGVAGRAYRDCNWSDNMAVVATFALVDDYATVQEYNSLTINILENDVFPEGFFDTPFSLCDSIIKQPQAGTISCVGNGADSRIIYTHTATEELPEGFDSFDYKMGYYDINLSPAQWVDLQATVYIYVLQSEVASFSACYGSSVTIQLRELPAVPEGSVEFYWFTEDEEEGMISYGTPNPRSATTILNIQADSVYYISPVITGGTYGGISFPYGKLTIPVVNPAHATATLRWTGITDTNWFNPNNWEERDENGQFQATMYVPGSCVDVIIPTGTVWYPELTRPARCNTIHLENRAMLAGIHHLAYEKASVELALTPVEKERFIMWSAPLKDMYSGDYHFNISGNEPLWEGDVSMNFFQSANPDGSPSAGNSTYKNAFTATFGNVGVPLELGRAFNLMVNNRNPDATFTFPKPFEIYTDKNNTYVLSRDKASRFIADAEDMEADGYIKIPVHDQPDYDLLQIPNPFMAYLKVTDFLAANPGLSNNYKVWNGKPDGVFVSVQWDNERGRYIIDDNDGDYSAIDQTGGYISPLQSFLVLKAGHESITELNISPLMTTTRIDQEPYPAYRYGEELTEPGVFRIRVSRGEHSNATILHFSENSMPAYDGREDAEKLFNPDSPLQIYSFAPLPDSREALAINSSNSFENNVRLGLRLQQSGEITFQFSGMEGFEHQVVLIDHDDDEKTYDLSNWQQLTFTIPGYSTGDIIDLPNRFSLAFQYNPTGNESFPEGELTVVSSGGSLHISAGGMEIDNLQVYNLWGQKVYQARKPDTHFKILAEPNQFYIVKGQLNYQIKVVKALAK